MIASRLRLPHVLVPVALAAFIAPVGLSAQGPVGEPAGPVGVPAQGPVGVPVGPVGVPAGPVGSDVAADAAEAATIMPAERRGFLDRQLLHPRVRRAYERRAARVDAALEARGVEEMGEVFFRVFKREQEMEVWVREIGAERYTLLRTYPVCETSGELGPKRRQGDRQIPEGFYAIDIFNPQSQYHLSMRVDYPNAVDQVRGHGGPLGGDIYIHGGCSTIGCVPVTDGYIEEIYLLAASARDAGQQQIPVHIFPTRLGEDGLRWLADSYGTTHPDFAFWENLQEGYLAFERDRDLVPVGYDGDRYTFRTTEPLGVVVAAPAPGLIPGSGLAELLPTIMATIPATDSAATPAGGSADVPVVIPATAPATPAVSPRPIGSSGSSGS
jgi:murein L,D-transpeptidase YafK